MRQVYIDPLFYNMTILYLTHFLRSIFFYPFLKKRPFYLYQVNITFLEFFSHNRFLRGKNKANLLEVEEIFV